MRIQAELIITYGNYEIFLKDTNTIILLLDITNILSTFINFQFKHVNLERIVLAYMKIFLYTSDFLVSFKTGLHVHL